MFWFSVPLFCMGVFVHCTFFFNQVVKHFQSLKALYKFPIIFIIITWIVNNKTLQTQNATMDPTRCDILLLLSLTCSDDDDAWSGDAWCGGGDVTWTCATGGASHPWTLQPLLHSTQRRPLCPRGRWCGPTDWTSFQSDFLICCAGGDGGRWALLPCRPKSLLLSTLLHCCRHLHCCWWTVWCCWKPVSWWRRPVPLGCPHRRPAEMSTCGCDSPDCRLVRRRRKWTSSPCWG